MGDHDTGGLPEPVQAEIRAAALEAIRAWRAGRAVAIPQPDAALAVEMLACAMAESIPPEYAPIIQVELPDTPKLSTRRIPVPGDFRVLIVGAGVSGLCLAIHLKHAGVPFAIVEKNGTVGGTWFENRYPGAGVDTPNHLYSYSFAPYDWSMYFALQNELHDYLEHVADRFGLRSAIEFNSEVERAAYDPANQEWEVTLRRPDGSRDTRRAAILVSAVGIFNPPKMPEIHGLASFAGPSFHTSQWPEGVKVDGQRVAMIGNGASAMQIGPKIQDRVASLTIFQREPHWIAPNEQFGEPIPDAVRQLLWEVPYYRAWYRLRLGWTFGDRIHAALQKDTDWIHPDRSLNKLNDAHRSYFTAYIESELGDRRDLLEQVVPAYPPFGKRMLMDNGWYRMLRNQRVALVSDPIVEVRPDRLVTQKGTEYEADALVIATGFDVLRFLTAFDIIGRGGHSVREIWDDIDARAYLGTAIPGFPNFFCLYGPNLQPGHGGSFMFVVEMQVRFVLDLIAQMAKRGLGAVDVRQDVHDSYNERIDALHERMVWTHPGMETYYRNERGRVVVNSPFKNADFFEMTRRADLAEFEVEPRVE